MAAIIPNIKDGKTGSHKFKSFSGRDEFGKQIFKCSTWHIPAGLSPSKAQKAAAPKQYGIIIAHSFLYLILP